MPEMRSKKVLISSGIILSLFAVGLLAYTWIFSPNLSGWDSCIQELSLDASYNDVSKTLDVNVTSAINKTITFQQLVVKDSKSSVIFQSTLPSVELRPNENI